MSQTFLEDIPEFLEIQRNSFLRILKTGLIESLEKINPISIISGAEYGLLFYPQDYAVVLPDITITEAFLQGKTYGCKIYVPALVYETKKNTNEGFYEESQKPTKFAQTSSSFSNHFSSLDKSKNLFLKKEGNKTKNSYKQIHQKISNKLRTFEHDKTHSTKIKTALNLLRSVVPPGNVSGSTSKSRGLSLRFSTKESLVRAFGLRQKRSPKEQNSLGAMQKVYVEGKKPKPFISGTKNFLSQKYTKITQDLSLTKKTNNVSPNSLNPEFAEWPACPTPPYKHRTEGLDPLGHGPMVLVSGLGLDHRSPDLRSTPTDLSHRPHSLACSTDRPLALASQLGFCEARRRPLDRRSKPPDAPKGYRPTALACGDFTLVGLSSPDLLHKTEGAKGLVSGLGLWLRAFRPSGVFAKHPIGRADEQKAQIDLGQRPSMGVWHGLKALSGPRLLRTFNLNPKLKPKAVVNNAKGLRHLAPYADGLKSDHPYLIDQPLKGQEFALWVTKAVTSPRGNWVNRERFLAQESQESLSLFGSREPFWGINLLRSSPNGSATGLDQWTDPTGFHEPSAVLRSTPLVDSTQKQGFSVDSSWRDGPTESLTRIPERQKKKLKQSTWSFYDILKDDSELINSKVLTTSFQIQSNTTDLGSLRRIPGVLFPTQSKVRPSTKDKGPRARWSQVFQANALLGRNPEKVSSRIISQRTFRTTALATSTLKGYHRGRFPGLEPSPSGSSTQAGWAYDTLSQERPTISVRPINFQFNPTEQGLGQQPKRIDRISSVQGRGAQSAPMVAKEVPLSKKEWVCIGILPLMTPRGHFIINGSHRIIVSQMSRAPGLYYQTGEKVQATIVPSKGAWLRITLKLTENGEKKLWVRITPQRKMPYKIFLDTYKYLESKSPDSQFKFLNLTYKSINSKIKHFDKHYSIGVISGQINRTLLNSSSYTLGKLGRKRLNERLGTNEKAGYITSKDISLIKESLIKLVNHNSTELLDDIDNLANRRVRTCGELLQSEIEDGILRLKKVIAKQLEECINPNSFSVKGFSSAPSTLIKRPNIQKNQEKNVSPALGDNTYGMSPNSRVKVPGSLLKSLRAGAPSDRLTWALPLWGTGSKGVVDLWSKPSSLAQEQGPHLRDYNPHRQIPKALTCFAQRWAWAEGPFPRIRDVENRTNVLRPGLKASSAIPMSHESAHRVLQSTPKGSPRFLTHSPAASSWPSDRCALSPSGASRRLLLLRQQVEPLAFSTRSTIRELSTSTIKLLLASQRDEPSRPGEIGLKATDPLEKGVPEYLRKQAREISHYGAFTQSPSLFALPTGQRLSPANLARGFAPQPSNTLEEHPLRLGIKTHNSYLQKNLICLSKFISKNRRWYQKVGFNLTLAVNLNYENFQNSTIFPKCNLVPFGLPHQPCLLRKSGKAGPGSLALLWGLGQGLRSGVFGVGQRPKCSKGATGARLTPLGGDKGPGSSGQHTPMGQVGAGEGLIPKKKRPTMWSESSTAKDVLFTVPASQGRQGSQDWYEPSSLGWPFEPTQGVHSYSTGASNKNKAKNFESSITPHSSGFIFKNSTLQYITESTSNKNFFDPKWSPSKIVGTKAFASALREFFGSNPLSQYMDQTNPLAEITHKRRLSSLGPGGVDRSSAGIAIRGIHSSHYGKICPIETPEGKNAGLVNSMTMWTRVNDEGFLETPYVNVQGGSIMSQANNLSPQWHFVSTKTESYGKSKNPLTPRELQPVNQSFQLLKAHAFGLGQHTRAATPFDPKGLIGDWASQQREPKEQDPQPSSVQTFQKSMKIVASDLNISESSLLPNILLPTRDGSERSFSRKKRETINLCGVSPMQNISVATSLIPFLEHDDATRALMGSNMQRQAVPLLKPQGPLVRTGLEGKVVGESGHALQALCSGIISTATKSYISIDTFNNNIESKSSIIGNLALNTKKCGFPQEIGSENLQFNFSVSFLQKALSRNQFFSRKNLPPLARSRPLWGLGKSYSKGNWHREAPPFVESRWALAVKASRGNDYYFKLLNKVLLVSKTNKTKEKKHDFRLLTSQQIPSSHKKQLSFFTFEFKNRIWRKTRKVSRNRQYQTLQQYTRSNQATVCVQRPAVDEGHWVQKGDLVGDCSASQHGVLALGQNIVVAYLPMEGFNFEDAIVVSDRLVHEQLYTSIHIQRVEFDLEAVVKKHIGLKIKVKKQKLALKTTHQDWITLHNPHLLNSEKKALNSLGIIKIGSWVGPGDVLVSKVIPVERKIAPSRHLLYAVFQEKKTKTLDTDDTSLRVPKNIHGRVINVKIVGSGTIRSTTLSKEYVDSFSDNRKKDHKETQNSNLQVSPNGSIQTLRPGLKAWPRRGVLQGGQKHKSNIDNLQLLQQRPVSVLRASYGVPPQQEEVLRSISNFSLAKPVPMAPGFWNAEGNPNRLVRSRNLKSFVFLPQHVERRKAKGLWLKARENPGALSPSRGLSPEGYFWFSVQNPDRHEKSSRLDSPALLFAKTDVYSILHPFYNSDEKQLYRNNFSTNFKSTEQRVGSKGVVRGWRPILPVTPSWPIRARRAPSGPSIGEQDVYGLRPTVYGSSACFAKGQPKGLGQKPVSEASQRGVCGLLRSTPQALGLLVHTKGHASGDAPQGHNAQSRGVTEGRPPKGYRPTLIGLKAQPNGVGRQTTSSDGLNSFGDSIHLMPLNHRAWARAWVTSRLSDLTPEYGNPSPSLTAGLWFFGQSQQGLGQSRFLLNATKFTTKRETEEPSLRPKGKQSLSTYNNPKKAGTSKDTILEKEKIDQYKIIQIRVYIAERKNLQVGDKMSGRHGNKGIVSTILPREDMPYLPDGTCVDMVLNPLGIPSRMNVGQVFECLLGLAASVCGETIGHTPFDEMYGPEASRSLVYLFLYVARLRARKDWLFQPNFPGKTVLFDGRTGTPFEQWVTVGRAYMLKLIHMVDEKIHARSIGPRSLVTQQPVKGRARGGGQRLGEMELWAFEGFGAAYTLQEILTLKSDDIKGREKVENSIIFARTAPAHIPETFRMMLFELRCLCLNIELNQCF